MPFRERERERMLNLLKKITSCISIQKNHNKKVIKLFGIKITYKTKNTKKRHKLSQFEVHLAEHCNLNCQNCDHFSPIAKESCLNIDIFESDLKRLSFLTKKDVDKIYLLGGEPLLNKDITKFMLIARKYFPNTEISIVTNGILLLDMNQNFWDTCKNCKISIIVTKYPIGLDYEKIEKTALCNGVDFSFFGDTGNIIKTSYLIPLDIKGKGDKNKNFNNCYHANTCVFLREGKLYTCPVAPNIRHFNNYFNQQLPDTNLNSIDIYKAKNIKQILNFLSKPIPLCKFCDIERRHGNIPWKISSKNITEWTCEN